VLSKAVDMHTINNAFTKLTTKLADPLILTTIKHAIKFLCNEFIIGYDIESSMQNARAKPEYFYSFDLLGESARTTSRAEEYFDSYLKAIEKLNFYFPCSGEGIYERPNLSIKLSAFFPRVELLIYSEIQQTLIPRLLELISRAQDHRITITFDAEESKRQDVYLSILTEIVQMKEFKNFDGIGFVVQAYQKRALSITEFIVKLAKQAKKKIPVRLVKGAYWDTEIKYAQENGFVDFPVFTHKEFTDAHYIACAKKMLENSDYIYPQFATHNALTASTILDIAGEKKFELQKLYGMGNSLHNELVKDYKVRVYAPIGKMKDLLPYLIRRLLENGASTSFVNIVNDDKIDTKNIVKPISERVVETLDKNSKFIMSPAKLYKNRNNSLGMDLGYIMNIEMLQTELNKYYNKVYIVGSLIDSKEIIETKYSIDVFRPGNNAEKIGEVSNAKSSELKGALEIADSYFSTWAKTEVPVRVECTRKLAILLEDNKYEIYSLLIREGGKSVQDSIGEVREAIDFCNYYALQAEKIIQDTILPGPTGEQNILSWHPRGTFLCISPWNFPLAIFLGQIIAALVAGNTVLAKAAGQTSLIANFVVKLAYKAGIPTRALQFLIASGSSIGETIVSDNRIKGIAFTGSTETAKSLNITIAQRDGAIVPLIAETGGQNAMIVDSSALLEQVTDDVIYSAFYSAGQRCSALRILYIQEEIYEPLVTMIVGAMQELKIGDTTDITYDIGPVIDQASKHQLQEHINRMQEQGFKLISAHNTYNNQAQHGSYFYPHIIEVGGINDLESETFGPILHVCKYKSSDLEKVIEDINNYGYGLTFGLQTRIDKKITYVKNLIKAGNIYINRSIIGAQVESQPFGGENKSGTGFKAGGPHYLMRFMTERAVCINLTAAGGNIKLLSEDN